MAPRESNALKNERDHKLAAQVEADERDAAMVDGRPQGGADDGAVPDGRQRLAFRLASPPPRPSHVCTPLTFLRDGA